MEVAVEYELSNQDIANSTRALPQIQTMRRVGVAVVVIGCARLVLALVSGTPPDWDSLLVIALVGVFVLFLPHLAARRALQNYTPEERRVKMRFDQTGCRIASGKGESSTPWHAVHRVIESKEVLLIFVSERLAQFLPKRLLSDDDLAKIRALVKDNVKPRKAPAGLTPSVVLKSLVILGTIFVVLLYVIYVLVSRQGG